MNTQTAITQDNVETIVKLVKDRVNSDESKRAYGKAIRDFMTWWAAEGKPPLIKATVQKYKSELHQSGLAPSTVNLRISAIRKLASEAADNGFMPQEQANGIGRVKGVTSAGVRKGNWLTKEQAQTLLNAPDTSTLKGLRDRAILAVMLGAGLRRSEVANLTFEHVQQREGRWAIVDLVGKRNRVRTIPIDSWVKVAVDAWAEAAGITDGCIFRGVFRYGKTLQADSNGITPQVVYNVVKEYADELGFDVAAHDLRRTFAKLAHKGKSDLGQIQLNLGHASLKTTEDYLGLELDFTDAPGDRLGLGLE